MAEHKFKIGDTVEFNKEFKQRVQSWIDEQSVELPSDRKRYCNIMLNETFKIYECGSNSKEYLMTQIDKKLFIDAYNNRWVGEKYLQRVAPVYGQQELKLDV